MNNENKFENITGDLETIDPNKKLKSIYVNIANLIISLMLIVFGAGIVIGFAFLGKYMAAGTVPTWAAACIMLVFSSPGWACLCGGFIMLINYIKLLKKQNKVLLNNPCFTRGVVYRQQTVDSNKKQNQMYLSYIDYNQTEHIEVIDSTPFFIKYVGEDIPVMVAYTEQGFIILKD